MKYKCPVCNEEYEGIFKFCPKDGAKLIPIENEESHINPVNNNSGEIAIKHKKMIAIKHEFMLNLKKSVTLSLVAKILLLISFVLLFFLPYYDIVIIDDNSVARSPFDLVVFFFKYYSFNDFGNNKVADCLGVNLFTSFLIALGVLCCLLESLGISYRLFNIDKVAKDVFNSLFKINNLKSRKDVEKVLFNKKYVDGHVVKYDLQVYFIVFIVIVVIVFSFYYVSCNFLFKIDYVKINLFPIIIALSYISGAIISIYSYSFEKKNIKLAKKYNKLTNDSKNQSINNF